MARIAPVTWRYRAAVASRSIAALLGCYAACSAIAMALARILPMSKAGAATAATIAAALIFPVLVMMVFAVRSAWRAWIWVIACTLLGTAIFYLARMPS